MTEPGAGAVTVLPVRGLPEIRPGDDLGALIAGAAALQDGDVVVVAQKVVSKAEGALVEVSPREDRATVRAALVRREAVRIVAEAPWTVIVETRHGLVCANAGIDASNVEPGLLALLPADPDASARGLRDDLRQRAGVDVAVVVTDTFGRPWREGQTDVAIGLAGLPALRDERGGADRYGATLEVTVTALADEVAAAADLVRRKAEGVPVVVVRGLAWKPDEGARATDLQRPAATDLFARGRGALADALAEPPAPARGRRRGDLPDPDAWRRIWKAADRAGEGRVAIELVGGSEVVVQAADAEPEQLVALGAAVATLRAALADFGWATAVERPRRGYPLRTIVRVGHPVG